MSGSYFELLGLPERFDLARPAIEAAYLDRTREVHPDRFATAAASERVAALQRSMQLNDAYQTLRQPVRRAEYLLNRHGVIDRDFFEALVRERPRKRNRIVEVASAWGVKMRAVSTAASTLAT